MKELALAAAMGLLALTLNSLMADAIAGNPARGHELAQRWCTACHLIGPEQQRATDAVPTFASVARRPATNAQSLRTFLLVPHYARRMPDLHLSRPEIDDLVAYILSLRPTAQ